MTEIRETNNNRGTERNEPPGERRKNRDIKEQITNWVDEIMPPRL